MERKIPRVDLPEDVRLATLAVREGLPRTAWNENSEALFLTSSFVQPDAATAAAEDNGRQLEVIDLRTLAPLDLAPVYESVRKTGRAITVHEAPLNLGLGAEIAARVSEQCFFNLEAPVLRVGGFDTPYPPSRVEEEYLPDLDRVLDMVDRSLAY